MRLAILDSYYPSVFPSIPFDANSTYDVELQKALDFGFGTADFYSRNLRALGVECVDIIANHEQLQRMWAKEQGWPAGDIVSLDSVLVEQIHAFKPDVVFFQDLSLLPDRMLRDLHSRYLLAGQISCALPWRELLLNFDVLFTSFHFYVEELKHQFGIPRVEYLPLAFEPTMLHRDDLKTFLFGTNPRNIDIAFVGGLGRDSHWKRGTDTLETVAKRYPDKFAWWGYKVNLESIPLLQTWWGERWGRAVYDIYARAKIVINRHGEVSRGLANNLRLFEATGMGALVMTEEAENLHQLFPENCIVTYSDAEDLCDKINYYLTDNREREAIAKRGQKHTLAHHTYAQRMQAVNSVLSEALQQRQRQNVYSRTS